MDFSTGSGTGADSKDMFPCLFVYLFFWLLKGDDERRREREGGGWSFKPPFFFFFWRGGIGRTNAALAEPRREKRERHVTLTCDYRSPDERKRSTCGERNGNPEGSSGRWLRGAFFIAGCRVTEYHSLCVDKQGSNMQSVLQYTLLFRHIRSLGKRGWG